MKLKKATALLLAAAMTMAMFPLSAMAEEEEVVSDSTESGSEDTAEINVVLLTLSPIDSEASQHVADKLNEMLLDKINVQANFQWMDASNYMQQVPMMLQASEQVDLLMFTPMPGAGYDSFMSQNQLMDITEYLDEYGQDIESIMGDYLKATSKGGKIYGVSCNADLSQKWAADIRGDILDNLGLTEDARNAQSWSDLEKIFDAIKEDGTVPNVLINADAEGTIITTQPFLLKGDSFADAYWVDGLGDSYQYVYGDPADNKVKNFFANEDYINGLKKAREYYEKGYIYKDAATTQDYGTTQIKNGVGAVMFHAVETGNEATMAAGSGFPDVEVDITSAKVATGSFRKFGFAVPVTAAEPEAAVKFLNLLYTDQDVMDTLTWGEEGVDWVKKDDGTATYPDGVTAETVQYHTADFLYGNRLQITPWEGEGADTLRETQKAGNEAMELSPFFGFSVDSSAVAEKVAAVKNVVDQYKPSLSSGVVEDVDGTVQEMLSEMDAAGMQDILAEYQSQLDAWLAQQ